MKKDAQIENLFQEALESLYEAETEIAAALPKMMAAASYQQLAGVFESHLEETKEHVARLETIFETLGEEPTGRESEGIKGILRDGEKLIEQLEKSNTLDVALTAAGRKVEHWEIAAYESISGLAEVLSQQRAVELLQQTLEEERDADESLTEAADAILSGESIEEGDEDEVDIADEELIDEEVNEKI